MKLFPLTLLSFVATATAFTPHGAAQSTCRSTSALKMVPDEFAQSEIDSNDVVVFSKSYCPFCTKTKDLFTEMGVDFVVHEMDEMGDDGPDLQMALMKMTGQKSVPNVFVKQQHIGGNDDTQSAAKAGKLKELLGI